MKILNLSAVLVLALQLSGCSHFIIHEEDSVPIVAAKITGRSFGCILTLIFGCASEWSKMSKAKDAEEASTPVVTASGLQPNQRSPQRIVIWGNHPGMVSVAIEDFHAQGQTVVERSKLEALLKEQQVRLVYSTDSDADVLRVGKLIGADMIVFAEATSTSALSTSATYNRGSGNARTSTIYHLAVALRGVTVETGEIQWTSTARFPGASEQPELGLVTLTKAALARSRCQLNQGSRWSNRLGCVVQE
jgi:curli production assembly/transport component CsgG